MTKNQKNNEIKNIKLKIMELPSYDFMEPSENQEKYDYFMDELYVIYLSNIQDSFTVEIENFRKIILPKIESLDKYNFFDHVNITKDFAKIYNKSNEYSNYINNLVFDILRCLNHILILEFHFYVQSNNIEIPDNALYNYHYFLYTQKLLQKGIDEINQNTYISKDSIYDICRKIYAGC